MTSNPLDTVYWNNNSPRIEYTVVVENNGNNLLTGNCELQLRYNQYPLSRTRKSWQAQNFEVGELDTLHFIDTLSYLNLDRYKGGDNIIVIWPHTDNPGAQVPDTMDYGIYVTDLTGVQDPAAVDARIDIFPNPATDRLSIQYLENRNKLECVRIIGLDGKVQYESSKAVDHIDIGQLSAGLYFVEFKFKDGIYGAMRLLKE
jgi:Secretion system C-terminal sorting domain